MCMFSLIICCSESVLSGASDQDVHRIFAELGDTEGIWKKKACTTRCSLLGTYLIFPLQLLEQIPLGKAGSVEDVSGLVSYLASEESKYVTGENYLLFDKDI